MRTLLLISLALTGCMKTNPAYCEHHPEDTAHCGNSMIDAAIDAPDTDGPNNTPICYGLDNYEACLPFTPIDPVTLNGTLDTTAGTQCLTTQPMGWTNRQPAACFVVGKTITINNVSVSGNRPLVVLGETITIAGQLDAAAHETMPTKIAPGAPYPNCLPFGDTPTNSTSGAGGGAGASFMTTGGSGGAGNNSMAGNHGGVSSGADAAPPGALRGGCQGQKGGDGNSTGGAGGGAGGAVYIASSNTITFGTNGIINVSGGGGHASSQQGGGGGGGAGGMIVLYAKTMLNGSTAKLLANGGGGASGTANGMGVAGQDPMATTPLVQATAVTGPGNCCAGNVGYAGGMDASPGNNGGSGQSGGGGGGGGGYIQSNKAVGSQVSPPATIN